VGFGRSFVANGCYVDEDLDSFRRRRKFSEKHKMVVVKGVLGWGWIKVMFVRWFIPKFYQKCIRTLRLVTVVHMVVDVTHHPKARLMSKVNYPIHASVRDAHM
jgi:hypothetical protein